MTVSDPAVTVKMAGIGCMMRMLPVIPDPGITDQVVMLADGVRQRYFRK